MKKFHDLGSVLLRVVIAATFLSPVADRFGWWGQPGQSGVAWGNWDNFVTYTMQVNSFAPSAGSVLAIAATALEIIFALMLLIGYKTRLAATGSAALLFLFCAAMAYSFGIKSPLDYSVWIDFGAAFLLATLPRYKWSLDDLGVR